MKKSILFGILVVYLGCNPKNHEKQTNDYSSAVKTLQDLLHNGEYFKLQGELKTNATNIPIDKLQFYNAFVESAFNHYPKSISLSESILKNVSSSLRDSDRVELMLLLRDDYFKTYQYKKAAQIARDVLNNYKNVLGQRLHDVENTLLIHEALKLIPPQTIAIKKVALKWKMNELGLIEIPIRTGTTTLDIVFDTRAHISTVTESFAKKLKLRILNVSFEESSGITGKTFKSGLGVADSLYIGDILVQNAVFQVLPDEQLYFPSLNYTLPGILGFQVITQLREVHIKRGGDFIISPTTTTSNLHNLAFDGSTTVISAINERDTLSFHFDTGATSSEFYASYFNRYKTQILRDGKLSTIESGGAGGTIKTDVYVLPGVNLTIAGKKIKLSEVSIRTTPAFEGQKYFGNIGQDVIKQFEEMILNFDDMYLDFK